MIFNDADCDSHAMWCLHVDHGADNERMHAIGRMLLKLHHIHAVIGDNTESMVRAILDCPGSEPLHYDKDGCPDCVFLDPKTPESVIDDKARNMGLDPKAIEGIGRAWVRGILEGGLKKP